MQVHEIFGGGWMQVRSDHDLVIQGQGKYIRLTKWIGERLKYWLRLRECHRSSWQRGKKSEAHHLNYPLLDKVSILWAERVS
jgi:hypothetical protein